MEPSPEPSTIRPVGNTQRAPKCLEKSDHEGSPRAAACAYPHRPSSNSLEVGVFELCGVFQAEPKQSINADVRRPYECQRGGCALGSKRAGREENTGRGHGVNEVVKRCPDPSVDQITEHEEIRCEKGQNEQAPASVGSLIKQDTERENCAAFHVEEQ